MLSIREALEQMLPHFQPRGSERVPLLAAAGRILARDLTVEVPLPEFDNSAMDGYALRFSEVAEGVPLRVVGESRAGGSPQPMAAKSVQRILTGAPMPPGADTVVMQEHVERTADEIVIRRMPRQGANVRLQGSECKVGATVIAAGAILGPGEIGLHASQSHSEVEVYRRPRVAILPTGDELRGLRDPRRPYSIVDSNTYALATAVAQTGCSAEPLAAARDDLDELVTRIREGLQADVLLTVGGVSVGEYDFVSEALRAAGVSVGFHKVAIKPGKPLLFGMHGETPVIGLPGNPVSALVTFEVFVRPGLLRMQGLQDPFTEHLEAVLAEPYQHTAGRTELVRARVYRQDGAWIARLNTQQGSGALSSMVASNAFVVIPAQCTQVAAGERVQALVLSSPRRPDTPIAD